jgi:L-ascorbate metabolism protein UlaG (beta-lactamase superfamily)
MLFIAVVRVLITMTVRHDTLDVTWLGYACARVSAADGPTVYVDPGRYGALDGTWEQRYGGVPHPSGPAYDAQDGDLVLITHDHHYQSDGIRRVAGDDATVLVYEAVDAERINDDADANTDRNVEAPEELPYDVRRVAYGDDPSVAGVDVDVLPAYNHADGPRLAADGSPMHPREFGCGYRFTVDGTSVFWTGDSDVLEAHSDLDVSLFLPSIEGSFTMNRQEAAELAVDLDPGLVVPIHYNTFEELRADSRAFAADVASQSIPVALDEGWPDWA